MSCCTSFLSSSSSSPSPSPSPPLQSREEKQAFKLLWHYMQDYGFRDHYKQNMFILQVSARVHTASGIEVMFLV